MRRELEQRGKTLVQDQTPFVLRRRVTGEMFFAVPCTSSPTQVHAIASPFTLTISISAALAGCWRLALFRRDTCRDQR